jgi:undecaprenyl diphosphate synthase
MLEDKNLPQCIGFIMDGNRRWAKERGLSAGDGHRAGYDAVRELVATLYRSKIPHAAFYAFSTENWKRAEEEVGYLMSLMGVALKRFVEDVTRDGQKINLRVVGDRERLPESLREEIAIAEARNTEEPELTVWFAISYGGRAEIIDAVNRAVGAGEAVTEESFEKFLWTSGMPDPDIIVRTSGEQRISNFLLWKASYSEFFFFDTLWPDFGETEFKSILDEYGKRKRRLGA